MPYNSSLSASFFISLHRMVQKNFYTLDRRCFATLCITTVYTPLLFKILYTKQKTMKNLIIFIFVIIIFSSCGPSQEERNATKISVRDGAQIDRVDKPVLNARIKSKYIRSGKYTFYEIIEVDGKEYLVASTGGIILLN